MYLDGGPYPDYGSKATLTDNAISNNTAGVSVGGWRVNMPRAPLWPQKCGGGVYLYIESVATLTNNTIYSNTAEERGGGVMAFYSDALLEGNTIADNTTPGRGGGVYVIGGVTMKSNVISGNAADWYGGGVAADGTMEGYPGTLSINDVIVDNQTNGNGSGVYLDGPANLLHTTIVSNTGGDGSGVYVTGDVVTLTNIILADQPVGIHVTTWTTATIVNGVLWHNTPVTLSQEAGPVVTVQNQCQGNPAFVNPSAWDYHIGATSAAVDAGIEAGITMDMDGEARPFDAGPDLGADERATTGTTAEPATASAITSTVGGLTTTVQIPTGAVTESTALTYTALAITGQSDPTGFSFAGHAFDLDAYQSGVIVSGFTFSVPVTVTLHYADADIAGLDEDSLVLEYWNGSAWVDAACGDYDRHPNENWLAVPICHLSRFALFGEREYLIYLPLVLRNS